MMKKAGQAGCMLLSFGCTSNAFASVKEANHVIFSSERSVPNERLSDMPDLTSVARDQWRSGSLFTIVKKSFSIRA